MNMIQKVTRNGAGYLYDWTKINAMNSKGEGLECHGPSVKTEN